MSIARSISAGFVLVVALTACDSGGPSPSTATATVGCDGSIEHVDETPDGYRVVAGSVAVPDEDQLLQVNPAGPDDGPVRMFAKWGLLVRNGSTATLSLAPEWADRARLAWGGADPAGTITVSACPSGAGEWAVFAGGIWVDEADCVPVRVEQVTVELSVGAPCSRPGG